MTTLMKKMFNLGDALQRLCCSLAWLHGELKMKQSSLMLLVPPANSEKGLKCHRTICMKTGSSIWRLVKQGTARNYKHRDISVLNVNKSFKTPNCDMGICFSKSIQTRYHTFLCITLHEYL